MRVYVATTPTISEFALEATVWPATVARRKPPTFECPFGVAGSTGRCNTFRELVCWGLIEQGLSGPFIGLPCDRAEFGLAMQGQIGAAWKILAQQSVGVFV
jgi:hypothetical protein